MIVSGLMRAINPNLRVVRRHGRVVVIDVTEINVTNVPAQLDN